MRLHSRVMAQPARQSTAPPPVDPNAIRRAYRLERAKRRRRDERARAKRMAGIRFATVLLFLLVLSVLLSLTIWEEIERLFGL
jgi:hypothetical protein